MTQNKSARADRWKVKRIHVSELEEYLNVLSRQGWNILYPFEQERTELGLEYIVIGKTRGGEVDGRTLDDLEKEAIELALERNGGFVTKAARSLGITKVTMYRKIEKYGIERDLG